MKRLVLDDDIQPLSAFRANATVFIQQVRDTKRPLVITQHGKSAAVLLDVKEYEALMDKLELLQEVRTAEKELDAGLGLAHDEAKKRVLESLQIS